MFSRQKFLTLASMIVNWLIFPHSLGYSVICNRLLSLEKKWIFMIDAKNVPEITTYYIDNWLILEIFGEEALELVSTLNMRYPRIPFS